MPSGEAPEARINSGEERAKEWLQCVEVGGKELVQSLEDSHLQIVYLKLNYSTHSKLHQLSHQSIQALEATAETVNTARQKGLPTIHFSLLSYPSL